MQHPVPHSLNSRFSGACAAYDDQDATALSNKLEVLSKELAQSNDIRLRTGISNPPIWPMLSYLWKTLLQQTAALTDDGEESDTRCRKELRQLCLSLSKFTRNLVPGIPANQEHAYENEPQMRKIMHYYTSWFATQEPETFNITRMLTQALSNIVTANEPLMQQLWNTYMILPEDEVVLLRLLALPDPRTVLATLVLISNCIHQSPDRSKKLCTTAIGARICVGFLDGMLGLYEAEESSDGAQAFDVGYGIFTRIIEAGHVPELYEKMAMSDEIITPSQTILLKLIDSYLQSKSAESREMLHIQLTQMLSSCFFDLSTYTQDSIKRAIKPPTPPPTLPKLKRTLSTKKDSDPTKKTSVSTWFEEENVESDEDPATPPPPTPPLVDLDVYLPKVCEALVLVTQCIVTITLDAEESTTTPTADFKALYNEGKSIDGQGMAESLVEVLWLLDAFLPRINFGKPVASPANGNAPLQPEASVSGFLYLKRDLVRLLGILCHQNKDIQDRIRNAGGISVVMNLCVIDERNPYLREHAIFTLHNLLEGNPESQAIVEAIEPSGAGNEEQDVEETPVSKSSDHVG